MDESLQKYYDTSLALIENYRPRNQMFEAMDDMYYSRWNMPEGMPDWVLRVVNTDPHDVVQTTVRTFATLQPKFKIRPMLNDQANRDRANQIETALRYNFRLAGMRNNASLEWDIMFSAALYAEVAAQIIYLPYQEKVLKSMDVSTARVKAARRFGDFAFVIHNPANIFPTFSEYGLESVLAVRRQTYAEFKYSWGKLAKDIQQPEDHLSYVSTFDFTDHDRRVVFAVFTELNEISLGDGLGDGIKILDKPNTLGFIPYAIKRFGNSLSEDTKEKTAPILQSVWDSNQWDTLNVMDSLDASLSIKRAAAARFAGEFPQGKSPEIDNTDPEGVLMLPAGTRNFQPLPNQSVDSRLAQNKLDHKARIWQGTVARALQTLEFPSGTAHSSVNQILSTATNSLAPYRMVAQHAMEELAYQMLRWIKFYGKEYGKVDLYGRHDSKTRDGEEIRISSDTIDPDKLEIEVMLSPDLPIDKLQQINGAVLLKNNFKVPESTLLEDLGIGDPAEMEKMRRQDDYKDMFISADLKRIQDAQQLETQQATMEMQMQAQQAAQQQQQQAQAQAQQQQAAQQAQAQKNAAPANQNLGGPGFDPSQGGTAPVNGARGQGRG